MVYPNSVHLTLISSIRYVEKAWVDKNGVQPCPEHYEAPNRLSDAGSFEHTCRKERRLSLEEEILTKHVAQAQLGPPRQRGVINLHLLFLQSK